MSHNKMLKLVAKHDEARKQQISSDAERGLSSKRGRDGEDSSITLGGERSSKDFSHSDGLLVNASGEPHGVSADGSIAAGISAVPAASAGPPPQRPVGFQGWALRRKLVLLFLMVD